jgi:hypothetical protein
MRSVTVLLITAICASLLRAQPQPPEIVVPKSDRGRIHPVFRVQEISPDVVAKIERSTWHAGCPVPVNQLRLLVLSYWNFNREPSIGLLIANKAVAKDLKSVFQKLFRHGFMIERMELIENYGGNDVLSMEANNTSGFNCRDITLHPGKFSNHSWGRAVDINPLTNPYVKGSTVLPKQGSAYLDRNRAYVGGILDGSYVAKLFEKRGWTLGGRWTDRQDYQHFEKPEQ